MIQDSGLKILLTKRCFLEQVGEVTGILDEVSIITVDDESLYEENRENLPFSGTSSNLAYIIYTSGSTGMPKEIQKFGFFTTNLCNRH